MGARGTDLEAVGPVPARDSPAVPLPSRRVPLRSSGAPAALGAPSIVAQSDVVGNRGKGHLWSSSHV